MSVTDPASTPRSGSTPRGIATRIPTRFCTTANTVAMPKKRSTCGPPTRSSDSEAPKPMLVKKAIISGACSVVSNSKSVTPCPRAKRMANDTRSPPITGAGML